MSRVQAAKRTLSYHDKGRCWRKFYRGKMRYLDPRGVARSDDAAYRKAVKNWERQKVIIDAEIELAEAEHDAATNPCVVNNLRVLHASERALGVAQLQPFAEAETPMAQQSLRRGNGRAASERLAEIDLSHAVSFNVGAVLPRMRGTGTVVAGRQAMIAGLIDSYITAKRALADAGEISRQMFHEYERNAKAFAEWASDPEIALTRVDQLDAVGLAGYRAFILGLRDADFASAAEANQLGPVTIRKRLARLKNLVEWAYENGHLAELPRNINSFAKLGNGLAREAEKSESELFWTPDECRELFRLAKPRTRLYILLALNCGYTQSDIATLRHAHVDLATGIVARPRQKTKGRTVHKLWPITLRYLKQEATKPNKRAEGGGLVLLTENERPLINESGNGTRQDAIRLAFTMIRRQQAIAELRKASPELFKRVKAAQSPADSLQQKRERRSRITKAVFAALRESGDRRNFKNFRKTSATLIERKYQGTKLADWFLGHTEKATKRFYVRPDDAATFEAIDYLDSVYRLAECE